MLSCREFWYSRLTHKQANEFLLILISKSRAVVWRKIHHSNPILVNKTHCEISIFIDRWDIYPSWILVTIYAIEVWKELFLESYMCILYMHSVVKFDFSTHFEIETKFQIPCNDYLSYNLILKFIQNWTNLELLAQIQDLSELFGKIKICWGQKHFLAWKRALLIRKQKFAYFLGSKSPSYHRRQKFSTKLTFFDYASDELSKSIGFFGTFCLLRKCAINFNSTTEWHDMDNLQQISDALWKDL